MIEHDESSQENAPTESSQQEAVQLSWRVRQMKKVRGRLYSKFPNLFPNPHWDDRIYLAERDQKKNQCTRVSEGEELRLRVMWAVELYGPAEIEHLYTKLEKLGWDSARLGGASRDAVRWIKQQRMYGSNGSYNLGLITRLDDKRFLHRDYFAPLPKEVDYLLVKFEQLSSSLTSLLIGFVFKEEYAKCYEAELQRDRKTIHRTIRGRFAYQSFGVEHLKREAIENARAKYREVAIRWFRKNAPGYFCKICDGTRMPTTELITCNNESLIRTRSEQSGDTSEWAELLIPYGWGDTWTNARCAGFKLRFDDFSSEMPFHVIATLRTAEVTEQMLVYRGGRTPGAFVNFSDEHLDGILGYHAALALLFEIGRGLKQSREGLNTARGRHSGVLKSIESIKSFFDHSLGIPAVIADLKKGSEHSGLYASTCEDFRCDPLRGDDGPKKIAETLRQRINFLADRILADEETTREHFEQIASIISTRESVKVQSRMEMLTVVALLVALLSLLAAALPFFPEHWTKAIRFFIEAHVF